MPQKKPAKRSVKKAPRQRMSSDDSGTVREGGPWSPLKAYKKRQQRRGKR